MKWRSILSYIEQGQKDDELKQWLSEHPDNQEFLNLAQERWKNGGTTGGFSPDTQKAWDKISFVAGKDTSRSLVIWISRIAAAVLIFMMGFGLKVGIDRLEDVSYNEVIAPRGHKSYVVLPDGSSVILNSESSIKYASGSKGENMILDLSGEAYFDVVPDPSRIFQVNTDQYTVLVHGTSFNLKSYKDEAEFEVALEKGSLSLFRGKRSLVSLKPDQVATINRIENKLYVQNKDLEIITSWKNDELIFDNTPFCEVIRYLERYYGVNIDLDPDLREAHYFTFRIKVESLRETLRLINIMSPIDYKINGKQVVITRRKTNLKNQDTPMN